VSLFFSAVLSAFGGFCLLAKSGEVYRPVWLVGDLRVVAAALLTGTLMMPIAGRALLSGLFLWWSLLLATIWRYATWEPGGLPVPWNLAPLNLMLLTVMLLGAQWAFARAVAAARGPSRPQRILSVIWSVKTFAGLLLAGVTAYELNPRTDALLTLAGAFLWLNGIVDAVVTWWVFSRPRAAMPNSQ
jgi:hypothetical protein